jgi:hypothetical protein
MPGYFLPEESQFRLAKLRDHVRFLVRLAQPRTPDEERAAEPKVRMGELAVCLELLADQVELVLDALSYPAQRTDTTHGARPAATVEAAPDVGGGTFRVTLAQLDRLTLLAETVSAHARVVAAGDATARAGQALPEVGDTLCDAANAMRALLLQIERQPLREPTPNGVREERAVYAVEWTAPPAGSGRLH